jgi:ABC-2 type transport system permease protein
MNDVSIYLADSATMLRRNIVRMRRYPMFFFIAGIPIVMMLLFVYVFGGTLGAGLGGVSGGRAEYVAYVVPGILLLGVAGGGQGTAIAVAMDMSEGIVARFRTMPISRMSVLTGHVVANVLQTMLAMTIVVAVAVLIGFRPTTGPIEWIGAAGILALTTLALTWISVAMGLVSKSVESASNLPMPLMLLRSRQRIVPTALAGLRFADVSLHPIMETLRRRVAARSAPGARRRACRRDHCRRVPLARRLTTAILRADGRLNAAAPRGQSAADWIGVPRLRASPRKTAARGDHPRGAGSRPGDLVPVSLLQLTADAATAPAPSIRWLPRKRLTRRAPRQGRACCRAHQPGAPTVVRGSAITELRTTTANRDESKPSCHWYHDAPFGRPSFQRSCVSGDRRLLGESRRLMGSRLPAFRRRQLAVD